MKPKEITKRIFALLLALIMAALCTACSGDNSSSEQNTDDYSKNTDKVNTNGTEETYAAVGLEKCTMSDDNKFQIKFTQNAYSGYTPGHFVFTEKKDALFPFQDDSGNWGYIDPAGKIEIECKYDEAGVFSEGKAFVKDTEGWYIIDREKNVLYSVADDIITSQFDSAMDADIFATLAGPFYHGNYNIPYYIGDFASTCRFRYSEKENISTYDILIWDKEQNLHTYSKEDFGENVCTWALPVFINDNAFSGFIIEKYYKEADTEHYQTVLYDFKGEKIAETDTEYLPYSIGSVYADLCDDNGKHAVIDIKSGKLVSDYLYDAVGEYSDGVIPVKSGDKWGLIDTEGSVLIEPQHKFLSKFSRGLGFALDFNGNGSIIDRNGSKTASLPDEFFGEGDEVDAESFNDSGFRYVYTPGGEGFLVNEKGEIIFSFDDSFTYVSANYVVCGDDLYKVVVE